jgi:hypothetical protein
MSIEQSLIIKGRGPTGTTIITIDDRGILDADSRIFNAFVHAQAPLLATPVANYIWRCKYGVWQVEYVDALVRVTGSTGCTCDVLVCQQVEAVASGVSQLTAVMDLEETAPFQAVPALIASPTAIFPGDSVAFNYGGTATGLIGLLTVILKRVL